MIFKQKPLHMLHTSLYVDSHRDIHFCDLATTSDYNPWGSNPNLFRPPDLRATEFL